MKYFIYLAVAIIYSITAITTSTHYQYDSSKVTLYMMILTLILALMQGAVMVLDFIAIYPSLFA